MNMTDPIADMLTRIRNGQHAEKHEVQMPASKLKLSIAALLVKEGYLAYAREVSDEAGRKNLVLGLKYYEGRPVIEHIKRISKPGLRAYRGKDDVQKVLGGLGVAIVSTSKGIMTDKYARQHGIGGEVLCTVY